MSKERNAFCLLNVGEFISTEPAVCFLNRVCPDRRVTPGSLETRVSLWVFKHIHSFIYVHAGGCWWTFALKAAIYLATYTSTVTLELQQSTGSSEQNITHKIFYRSNRKNQSNNLFQIFLSSSFSSVRKLFYFTVNWILFGFGQKDVADF